MVELERCFKVVDDLISERHAWKQERRQHACVVVGTDGKQKPKWEAVMVVQIPLWEMESPKNHNSLALAVNLTDDLIVKILSRLPPSCSATSSASPSLGATSSLTPPTARSSPRPSMASSAQSAPMLITRLPHITSFTNITGRGPSLIDASFSFLPNCNYIYMILIEDHCNCLLLFRRWKALGEHEVDFIVCNPATSKLYWPLSGVPVFHECRCV